MTGRPGKSSEKEKLASAVLICPHAGGRRGSGRRDLYQSIFCEVEVPLAAAQQELTFTQFHARASLDQSASGKEPLEVSLETIVSFSRLFLPDGVAIVPSSPGGCSLARLQILTNPTGLLPHYSTCRVGRLFGDSGHVNRTRGPWAGQAAPMSPTELHHLRSHPVPTCRCHGGDDESRTVRSTCIAYPRIALSRQEGIGRQGDRAASTSDLWEPRLHSDRVDSPGQRVSKRPSPLASRIVQLFSLILSKHVIDMLADSR